MQLSVPGTVLVAGAGGDIGQAIVRNISQLNPDCELLAISRSSAHESGNPRVRHLQADLTQQYSIEPIASFIADNQAPDWVFNCCGVLHDNVKGPEKALKQLNAAWLDHSVSVNVTTHVHLSQALERLLTRRQSLRMICLSAMVGSIADNRTGGWYSYRMSKAALNMFVKTLSIEWARRFPEVAVAAVHPGTTDSKLSKPFQSGLSADKLFTADTTASRMIEIMSRLEPSQTGTFFNWDYTILPW